MCGRIFYEIINLKKIIIRLTSFNGSARKSVLTFMFLPLVDIIKRIINANGLSNK
jgi:hypothetical protein